MGEVRSNLLLFLVLLLIFVSLVSPIAIHSKMDNLSTGKATATGVVQLTVSDTVCGDAVCDPDESCSTCSADCGACDDGGDSGGGAAGGSGGGGAARQQVVHMLDFVSKEEYEFYAYENDKVHLYWSGDMVYKFEIKDVGPNREFVVLDYTDTGYEYRVSTKEMAYFDMDADGQDDFSVHYSEGNKLVWTKIGEGFIGSDIIIPEFHKEEISGEGWRYPLGFIYSKNLIIIVSIILVIIIVLFVLQHFKIKGVEKRQKGKLQRLHKKYVKSKKRAGARSAYKDKLRRQKDVLKRAYAEGHVKKGTYKSSMDRINRYLGKAG